MLKCLAIPAVLSIVFVIHVDAQSIAYGANLLLAVVGIVGVGVGVCTLFLIKRQVVSMEKTLTLQFRPKIIVRTGEVHASIVANVGDLPTGTLEYTIANSGGTQARTIKGEVRMRVMDTESASTVYIGPAMTVEHCILEPGEPLTKTIELDGRVNEAVLKEDAKLRGAPYNGKRCILFLGSISYTDGTGIERSTAFMRRYNPSIRLFRRVRNPDREYTD